MCCVVYTNSYVGEALRVGGKHETGDGNNATIVSCEVREEMVSLLNKA